MNETPAGWYPQQDGRQRYWDGQAWTEHVAPGGTTAPGAVAPGAPASEAVAEGAVPASAAAARPWFKKKRFLIPGGIVALFVIGSALSGGDDATTPVSAGSTTAKPVDDVSPSATPSSVDQAAKAKAEADAKARADADAKAKAAAEAEAKAEALDGTYNDSYGTFKPIVKSGRGDATVALPKGAAAGLVTFSHKGSSNVAAIVLDSSNQPTGDLLVNEIGRYSGSSAYGLTSIGEAPTKIKITADGSWSIRISPIASAPVMGAAAKGTGDKVFRYDGKSADWAITHKGHSNFAVIQVGGVFPDVAVNEIGTYKGVVPLTEGPSVIAITADGAWTVTRR